MNINRKEIIAGLNRISSINSQLVKISVVKNLLTLKTYNNFSKIQYETKIENEIDKSFSICINAKIINNIISKTDVDSINLEKENDSLEISFENSKFSLNAISEENFNDFLFKEKSEFKNLPLTFEDLAKINKYVVPYCVEEQSEISRKLSSTNCINLVSDEKHKIDVYATDGKRLSKLKLDVNINANINFLIYSKTFTQVLKCLTNKDLLIYYDDQKIFFVNEKVKVEIDLMAFSFPNVSQIANDAKVNLSKIDVYDLVNKLERGSIISNNTLNSSVYFSFEENKALLSFKNSEQGYASEVIKYELKNGIMPNFSINITFLLTALKNVLDKNVYFSINDNLSPLFIYDDKDENLLQVILPTKSIF